MVMLPQTLLHIIWSALLIVCWLKDEIKFKISPARPAETLLITPNEFKDKSDIFEVIKNGDKPDFILYLAKQTREGGRGTVYRYDHKKGSFVAAELVTSAGITSVDEILAVSDKMFCVSREKNVSFYLNERMEIEDIQTIQSVFEYLPNPKRPRAIARLKRNLQVSSAETIFDISQSSS
ncbi:hypothetical protein RF11_08777 [Thelohanellus kitauei]|uniref:Uncharacterized protein n=1 Tax=Thelohanellus kitauei TaxID=669202 RepID=A0A0C2MVA5_THEKT|nr:hypothetical protein RF11_06337 [Thelohanellus kitauei]KII71281.1 hypothetical protein RF11_08777 [Thelohanellus kitauei]